MGVKVEKLSQEALKKKGVFSWSVWEKDISRFNWQYDSVEECYFLKGRVALEMEGGGCVAFGEGDFVTFPRGLKCVWDIKEPVKQHYRFI